MINTSIHPNRIKILTLISTVLSLILCAQLTSETQSGKQQKSLGKIYRDGIIQFIPVLKISPDSIPDHIRAKSMINLVQGPDKLYVSDIALDDVKVFNLNGKFIKKFGIKGKGPGDLLAPTKMCISKERLVVWEARNRRFSFFSPGGKFIKIEKPKLKGNLADMKALDDGRIILEIVRVEANKDKKEIFEWRVLELYSSEMKFIKEVYRQEEHQYKYFKNPNPRYRLRLPFRPRLCWDVLPGGEIAASFTEKYQIKIIDIDSGRTQTISRGYSPVKVTEADKKKYLDMQYRIEGGVRKDGADQFTRDNIEFPDFKPALIKLITDIEGHIMVFPFLKSHNGKFELLVNTFDVFDSKGIFINQVKIKDNKDFYIARVISVKDNEFWCLEADFELGIRNVKYKAM